jgi:predicted DNA-binding protein with PD1-like motif
VVRFKEGTSMTYQLYRLAESNGAHTDALLLGAYDDFDEALAARDQDTVLLFAITSPGEVMAVHHDIVGPGADGPFTAHPVSTAVERTGVAGVDEVEEIRGWLARIRTATG